jgi:hypothetical protein
MSGRSMLVLCLECGCWYYVWHVGITSGIGMLVLCLACWYYVWHNDVGIMSGISMLVLCLEFIFHVWHVRIFEIPYMLKISRHDPYMIPTYTFGKGKLPLLTNDQLL